MYILHKNLVMDQKLRNKKNTIPHVAPTDMQYIFFLIIFDIKYTNYIKQLLLWIFIYLLPHLFIIMAVPVAQW